MNDYPDPDEEFDLMYGDDLDVLREQEEERFETGPSNVVRRSLDFSSPAVRKTIGIKSSIPTDIINSNNEDSLSQDEDIFTKNNPLNLSGVENITESLQGSQKRNIEDLFGDIDDLDYEDSLRQTKKSKNDIEEDNLALIDKIIQERRRKCEQNNPVRLLGKDYTLNDDKKREDNISQTLPRWPFVTITKSTGEKLYVRCHDEEYMEREINEITKSHEGFKSLLKDAYKDDWQKAVAYVEKKKASSTDGTENDVLMILDDDRDENTSQMWVEHYKPSRYMELLSDESTNRTLLQWLKMWDKIVFNKEVKVKKNDISSKFNKRSGKFEFGMKRKYPMKNLQEDMLTEFDEHNRPKYKVALLCGPPGCGKTTLAHMIAKHAGYKPIEINASDDRSVDAFKLALENATQMKSVLDQESRPNCLILDEIDGAPLPTIEYLIKFISGVPMGKAKKGQKAKPHILKRPVICICNDAYTSSLKPLRQVAFVVHFPPTQISRLTQRLTEISIQEGLKVDSSVLTALSEKTQNDIRSCLGVLHFFKSKGKQIKLADINTSNIGQKDMTKGLFQVWQEIFQIQLPKHQRFEDTSAIAENKIKLKSDSNEYDASLKSRSKKILHTVQSAGDYERLMQGVYENFLDMKMRDSMLLGVCQGLDWFVMADLFNNFINSRQNYSLMPYLPFSFVNWHFLFSGLNWPKIKFPTQSFEMYQKQCNLTSIITAIDKGICPRSKPFVSKTVLALDSLPMLPHIITPTLRPVNVQLYTKREKLELATVVGVMLDYGIQYTQERSQDGTYNYVLDPDISKVGVFDEKTFQSRNLTYATKQLISREVDLEKIKRNELKSSDILPKGKTTTENKTNMTSKPAVPNHLQRLQPKQIKAVSLVSKDFFGRTVTCSPATAAKRVGKIDDIVKSPIWYHYKEGYNNAVRRDVKIGDLL